MDRDWDEAQANAAALVALVGETRDRTLSKEEIAGLSAAVKLLADVKRELKKEHPSMDRIEEQVYKILGRRGRGAED